MKVQEEDKEIALIEQSYDAGEENSTQVYNVLSIFFRSFASTSVCHVGSARSR